MNKIYQDLLVAKPPRATFDLEPDTKMSFKMGYLTPTFWEEVLPGDNWQIKIANMIRSAPLVSPVMDEVTVRTDLWYCSNRILWDTHGAGWEEFISPSDDTQRALIHPYFTNNTGQPYPVGSLADYLELPIDELPESEPVNALPFRAYELIWHEFYRDQNLQDGSNNVTENIFGLNNGDNTLAYSQVAARGLRRKAWDKDRFTAALPFAQKGTQVTLPLVGGEIPVDVSSSPASPIIRKVSDDSPLTPIAPDNEVWLNSEIGGTLDGGQGAAGPNEAVYLDPNGSLSININASAATINELREAYALQRFYELDATGGTRYQEMLYAHFGVRGKDLRGVRPKFIGRLTQKFTFSEVLQTTAATPVQDGEASPLGTMGGHGISVGGGKFNHYADEHGIIMGIIHVMPKATYYKGLQRKFSRKFRLDHYFPKMAHIGEQPILNKEVHAGHVDPNGEWGYVPVWHEYRESQATIAGDFRNESLNHWHLARNVSSTSNLNGEFITALPTNRIFAVQFDGGVGSENQADHFYALIMNRCKVSRLMPYWGKPI